MNARPHTSPLAYGAAFVALLGLTALTYGLAQMHLGAAALPVALAIAATKAGIVAMVFMHLAKTGGVNRIVFGVAILFVVILISLVLTDVKTRSPAALPPRDGSANR